VANGSMITANNIDQARGTTMRLAPQYRRN
jgi:hypothetical protein